MDDAEAGGFYADPANQVATGPGRERSGPWLTSTTSVRFPPAVIAVVKDLAAAEGVTVGAWVRRLVQREIDGLRTAGPARPRGVVAGSGRAGAPRALGSALPVPQPRMFACPHFRVGNVTSAACRTCGPLAAAA